MVTLDKTRKVRSDFWTELVLNHSFQDYDIVVMPTLYKGLQKGVPGLGFVTGEGVWSRLLRVL